MKTFFAIVTGIVLSTQALALPSNELYNQTLKDLRVITNVKYIHGDYAKTPLTFLNPFKSRNSILRKIEDSVMNESDLNGDKYITEDEYAGFLENNKAELDFADTNNDGEVDRDEMSVIYTLSDAAEKSKGATFGCDAILKAGDVASMGAFYQFNPAILIPMWKKCAGI